MASGTITSRQDAVDYLSWTYFFRRLLQNPTFYGLESTKFEDVKEFLLGLVDATLEDLADAGCVLVRGLPLLFFSIGFTVVIVPVVLLSWERMRMAMKTRTTLML